MRIAMIGSGRLALGLIYPWLSSLSGCDLTVITRAAAKNASGQSDYRPSLRESGQYTIRTAGVERLQAFDHELVEYVRDDFDDPGSQRAVTCLEQSDVVAVSVGAPHLPQVAGLIGRACRHSSAPPLHILAFENLPNASAELAAHIRRTSPSGPVERELHVHTVIPDRACGREVNAGRLLIEAETFGEILLESSAGRLFAEIHELSAARPLVRHITSAEISLAEMRKYWIVNGTHAAVALLCADRDIQMLADGLSDDRVRVLLPMLHDEWIPVLAAYAQQEGVTSTLFGEDELRAHALRMYARLEDQPDFAVLDAFREFSTLSAFERYDLAGLARDLAVSDPAGDSLEAPGILGRLTAFEDESRSVTAAIARILQKLDDRLGHQVRTAYRLSGMPVPVSGWILSQGVHIIRRKYTDPFLNS